MSQLEKQFISRLLSPNIMSRLIVLGKLLMYMVELIRFKIIPEQKIKSTLKKIPANIFGNTLEAIVGAIYLDSDYLETQKTVLNWFKDLINDLDEKCLKDPKTRLQEYCQANAMELPVYNLDKVTGNSPDQVFYVSIEHKSSSVKEKASGNSRKIAEQIAAEKLLKIMENK